MTVTAVLSLGLKGEVPVLLILLSMDDEFGLGGARGDGVF